MSPDRCRAMALGCLLLLAGCSQWHYDLGRPLAPEQVGRIERGVALATVLAQLGPPQRVSADVDGYLLAWEYWVVKENVLGFSLGALGADFLSVDWGRARTSGEYLLVSVDGDHKVIATSLSTWDDQEVGSGAAVQPLVSVVSVVDVGDLVGRMPQHDWGRDLTRRLPEAINAPNSPDSGAAGLEQRGTPTGTGQRSLEMQ